MLPGRVENAALDLVARDFGADFAERLAALPVGEWAGPVVSGFGAHLVRVTAHTTAALPPLESIRPSVAREWENERRVSSRNDSYRKLRGNYTVVIEARLLPSLAAR
jgi:parvulin-like peptidyl-prolyl isomerase